MIHIYCGDGKGKTTAACGLALRAAGSGMKVLFAQFFKSGASSEVTAMSQLDNIDTLNADKHYGRYTKLGDEQKAEINASYDRMLAQIIDRSEAYDMVILDEAVSAYNYMMLNCDAFVGYLKREGEKRELVLTGRNPPPALTALADYITDMKKLKHPYDSGIKARRGIEY